MQHPSEFIRILMNPQNFTQKNIIRLNPQYVFFWSKRSSPTFRVASRSHGCLEHVALQLRGQLRRLAAAGLQGFLDQATAQVVTRPSPNVTCGVGSTPVMPCLLMLDSVICLWNLMLDFLWFSWFTQLLTTWSERLTMTYSSRGMDIIGILHE